MKIQQVSQMLALFSSVLMIQLIEAFQSSSKSVIVSSQGTIHSSSLTALSSSTKLAEYKNADSSLAITTRRSFFLASTGIVAACVLPSHPAYAKYGEGSNMELPNYIDFLIEKNKSLDVDKVLYKGADPLVLLQRLQEADKRLGEIPMLADQKKWSQIQGIITGPLGTLGQTINQISTAPDASSQVKVAAKKVKSDVIAIGTAASKKNGSVCADMSTIASNDLESFVKLAFE